MYLPMMEDAARFLFFIRPRRFGKSLFVNMMRAYYDKALKERFEELFGGTWIGEHPTALQGRYQVLHFDFSRIGSKTETLSDEFNNYCNAVLDSFMHTYADEYPEDVKTAFFDAPKANRKLNILNLAASKLGISQPRRLLSYCSGSRTQSRILRFLPSARPYALPIEAQLHSRTQISPQKRLCRKGGGAMGRGRGANKRLCGGTEGGETPSRNNASQNCYAVRRLGTATYGGN